MGEITVAVTAVKVGCAGWEKKIDGGTARIEEGRVGEKEGGEKDSVDRRRRREATGRGQSAEWGCAAQGRYGTVLRI